MRKLDEAFEEYRKKKFGAYEPYPVDAYTYFGAGWKAAMKAASDVALTIDSKRGNEAEIAKALTKESA